ncbi:hypothetical protein HOK00_00845 [bacterium]|nr:hypothetical protein [bacterium]
MSNKVLERDEELKKIEELYDIFLVKGRAYLNQLSGLSPRNQFSLGLFLKLGILFDFKFKDSDFDKDSKNHDSSFSNDLQHISKRMKAFVKQDKEISKKSTSVNIIFEYNSSSDLNKTLKLLETEHGVIFLIFVYLHEVQHIIRHHNTTAFSNMMKATIEKELNKTINKRKAHYLANIAEDFSINYSLINLFNNSKFSIYKEAIIKNGLYDSKYDNHNEIDILIDLLKNDTNIKLMTESPDFIKIKVKLKDGDEREITISSQAENEECDSSENSEEKTSLSDEQIETLSDSIQALFEQQKGNDNFKLNKNVGKSIAVDVSWFDKIKNNFNNLVMKKTKNYTVNWSNLNSKYRHIYKSPVKRNIDTFLNIILSIDNSGSMSIDSLKKILYIIEKKHKKINKITILTHDSTIGGILEEETKSSKILDFVSTRHCGGGTSHREIFKYLDDNFQKEYKDTIYISFSDNFSDIEDMYPRFKTIQKIDKIWLNCNGRDVSVPGTQVKIY